MYFSLVPKPGYNSSFLETHGIKGEWDLFSGAYSSENVTWKWGGGNLPFEGALDGLTLWKDENN